MNAVIHILTPFINGGLFDAFEYFEYIYSKSKDNYLVLLMCNNFGSKRYTNYEELKKIFIDKYNIDSEIFNNVIFLENHNKIMRYKFNNVLILDNHTYYYLDGLINANKYFILVDPYIPSKVDYKKLSARKNHFLFSELKIYENDIDNTKLY